MPQIPQPTGLVLTESSPGQVLLSWQNNAGALIVGYQVWRSTMPASGFVLVATLGESVSQPLWSAGYSNHAPGATYYYYVVGVSSDPNNTPSLPSSTESIQIGVSLVGLIVRMSVHVDPANFDYLVFREFTHQQPHTPTGYPAGYDPSGLPGSLEFYDIGGALLKQVEITPRESPYAVDEILITDLPKGLIEVRYTVAGDGGPSTAQFVLNDRDLECCLAKSEDCSAAALFAGLIMNIKAGRLSAAQTIYTKLKAVYGCNC